MNNTVSDITAALLIARRFRDYRPIRVTTKRVLEWVRQYPKELRPALWRLLRAVSFVSEAQMVADLQRTNERLIARLKSLGVDERRIIYVSFHEAGSSSAAVLNLIRDRCLLENRGCKFVDANNVRGLHDVTSAVGSGAIVYVDDFVGSGKQFSDVREFLAQHLVGNFSEYLLVHTICEEGIGELGKRNGVEPVAVGIHGRGQRPLHDMCTILSDEDWEQLRKHSLSIHEKAGLGFKRMATMVVFYRNAPNSVPLILRGNRGQSPLIGVVPRTTDLGVPEARAS